MAPRESELALEPGAGSGPFGRPVEDRTDDRSARSRSWRSGVAADCALLLATVLAALVSTLGAPVGVRAPLVLLYAGTVPGIAAVRLAGVRGALAVVVIGTGLSVAGQILLSWVLLLLGAFAPWPAWFGTLGGGGLLCVALLVRDIRRIRTAT